jgi:hypothetical protein
MANAIRLSKSLRLPLELVTESVAILAVKRAGKSHTAKKLTEQLHTAGQQVVVVDPKGDWWGIRSSADGKGPGLPLVIVGGEHGDVPLEPGAGELVAKLVVEERVSLVLDLSDLRKYQVATFMTAFLETLYRMKARDQWRTPMMLVIDEADAVAPQRPQKGEERMLGAAEDIVRRGGQRGIGITLVSQRAAVLNKNVLTQCGVLILLRTTGSQDIDAVNDWIKKHGQEEKREKVMGGIAQLPRGTAWVWAPGWPTEDGIFTKTVVDALDTFDSGATPKPGQVQARPKTMADVDLAAFRRDMAATIERAKQDDPKALRARIHELEMAIVSDPSTVLPVAPKVERVEVPVLSPADLRRLAEAADDLRSAVETAVTGIRQAFAAANDTLQGVGTVLDKARVAGFSPTPPRESYAEVRQRALTSGPARDDRPARRLPAADDRPDRGLAKGERIVLTAIAQYGDGITKSTLTVLTGYKRSSRDTYLSKLRQAGLVEEDGEFWKATRDGIARLGRDYDPLPTGGALREHWLTRLPGGEMKILQALVRVYPRKLDKETLSEMTGYQRSSRDTYLSKLRARRLLDESGGMVGASPELF